MAERKGLLIALEGIDGTGKSTLQTALAEALSAAGWTVCCSREPTAGVHGQRLREAARVQRLAPEEEVELLLADRREHVEQLIAPALARGEAVILDRYYYSTAAYQGAAGLDPAELIKLNETIAPRPDLVVILDLPPEQALQRIAGRGEATDEFERIDNLRRARAIFLALKGPQFLVLDARERTEASVAAVLQRLPQGPGHRAGIGPRAQGQGPGKA